MTHPQYPIPQDEEGRKRYESAKRHAALAKEQGKSLDEIHEIFKKVMNGTGKCSGRKEEAVSKCHGHYPIPEDEEGKKRYESALRHVAIAKENGKSVDELHAIFKKVMEGTGKCSGRKEETVSKCHGRYPMKKAKSAMNPLCVMWPLPKKTASLLMSSMRFSRRSWKAQASAAAESSNPLPEAEDMT